MSKNKKMSKIEQKIRSILKDKDKIPQNIQSTNGIKPKRVSS